MKYTAPFAQLFLFITMFSIVFCESGCVSDKVKNIPDVSAIPMEVKIRRFEKKLFSIDTLSPQAGIDEIKKEYPEFSSIFFNDILGANDERIAPQGDIAYINGFVSDARVRKLYDTCSLVFDDFSDMQADFNQAFKFYKYHFPDRPIPSITTFISEYGFAGFIYGENALAVGLDFYLGHDYPYRQNNPGNPTFSDYLTRTFNKDHLVARTLSSLTDDLVGMPSGNRMLDLMIHNGKKRYILEQLIPYASDTVLHEYTPRQMEWVEENESQIWALFLNEDFLYSSRQKDIRNYLNPSPNSPGMPKEAPGNVGSWMGYQIVSRYMEQFPDKTLEMLLLEKDTQNILGGSKYKPKR